MQKTQISQTIKEDNSPPESIVIVKTPPAPTSTETSSATENNENKKEIFLSPFLSLSLSFKSFPLTVNISKATKVKNEVDFQIQITNEKEEPLNYEISDLFHILDLESGETITPQETKGEFGSLPFFGVNEGLIIFNLPVSFDQEKIILQVGDENDSHFIEFNFTDSSYKEIDVG